MRSYVVNSWNVPPRPNPSPWEAFVILESWHHKSAVKDDIDDDFWKEFDMWETSWADSEGWKESIGRLGSPQKFDC